MKKVLVISGPNLNLLGLREPEIYGNRDYAALVEFTRNALAECGFEAGFYQSNHEGDIVDAIQEAYGVYDGIIINPAAYTHTSVAIPDAKLCFLAYNGTEKAPVQLKPEEGIFLEYAPMNRDFDVPASDVPQEAKDNIAKLIEVFGKEDSVVLEYWYDNSMFSKWTKPPKAFVPRNDLIPGDLRWYESLGFAHVASFACYLGEDYVNLYGEPDISAFC